MTMIRRFVVVSSMLVAFLNVNRQGHTGPAVEAFQVHNPSQVAPSIAGIDIQRQERHQSIVLHVRAHVRNEGSLYLRRGMICGIIRRPRIDLGATTSINDGDAVENSDNQPTTVTTSRYEDSENIASKGIVSSLTGIVNVLLAPFVGSNKSELATSSARISSSSTPTTTTALSTNSSPPPTSAQELMERIRCDYIENNYLWTGRIDLSCFDPNCRFTDPTLSFTGTDTFVKNVQSLTPIVNAVCENGRTFNECCRSDLLSITMNDEEGYIQSRWNMVGELYALPWKPKIDVIGRTKFWYKKQESNQTQQPEAKQMQQVKDNKYHFIDMVDGKQEGEEEDTKAMYQVYFYDEEWEMPAGKALLQLVTPANTISTST